MPFAVETHADDHRILVGAPTPFAGAMALATEIGVVQFYEAPELIRRIAVGHGLLNLVMHEPSGRIRESQFPAEREGRNPAFIDRDQKNGQKPSRQRHLGPMKDGADRHGRLVVTCGAFIQGSGPVGPPDCPRLGPFTTATDKTVGPTLRFQVLLTGLIRPEFFDPFRQRHNGPPLSSSLYLNNNTLPPLGYANLSHVCIQTPQCQCGEIKNCCCNFRGTAITGIYAASGRRTHQS